MNVSNLRQNRGEYCVSKLRHETMKIYLSITQCARSGPLSDPLKSGHRISSITFRKY